MHCRPGGVKENLARMEDLVSKASDLGADIVCFPELSVTGYVLKKPAEICRAQDSALIMERLARMAGNAGLLIIAGLMEPSDNDRPFISQVVAGPEGLVGRYRKTHLSPAEREVYSPGEEITVFHTEGAAIGVQLCYEAHFPEISTIMALKGAEVIFVPHASPRGSPEQKLESWLRHLTGRAFDNGLFVVACNQVGRTSEGFSFPGAAVVIGPDGRVLERYEGHEENLLLAKLSADSFYQVRRHRMRYFLPQRRPELYGEILKQ
jgi:predicted amidohydrolase